MELFSLIEEGGTEGGVKSREFRFTRQMIKELGQAQREGKSLVSCPGCYHRGFFRQAGVIGKRMKRHGRRSK